MLARGAGWHPSGRFVSSRMETALRCGLAGDLSPAAERAVVTVTLRGRAREVARRGDDSIVCLGPGGECSISRWSRGGLSALACHAAAFPGWAFSLFGWSAASGA